MEGTIPDILAVDPLDRPLVWLEMFSEMMIQMEMTFPEKIDADRLAKAVFLTTEQEPVLGCRFVHHWYKPFWKRLILEEDDVFTVATSQSEYDDFKHQSIDTYTGPQIRVCLWADIQKTHVLIKADHHAADAAGLKDIVRVMSSIYSRLALEPKFKPKPNLNRSENTFNLLKAIPKKDRAPLKNQFQEYMKQVRNNEGIFRLPFENGPAENPFYTHRTMSRDQVNRLIQYGRSHEATLNDLLMVAVFRSQVKVGQWDGKKHLRITTTMDLRRHLEGNRATAVTNFSLPLGSWPNLGKDLGADYLDTLKKIKNATQDRKNKFFGLDMLVYSWPMLRYVPHALAIRFVRNQMSKDIKQNNIPDTFSNTGVIDPADVTFGSKPILARVLPPPMYPPYFTFTASGYDGTLTFSFAGYPVHKDLAERFFDCMVDELTMKSHELGQ